MALDPVALFGETERRLGHRYRLERLVAAGPERVLFVGRDTLLNRRVSVRVNFSGNDQLRTWFIREAEALGQLDHPAIRHVYDVGIVDDMAFRIGNWIEAEGLSQANVRGPRPIPQVHILARDLLRAIEHAHANGIVVRRVVPTSLLVNNVGRGTITDLRFCSYTLPHIPAGEIPTGRVYMAPEVRDGSMGDAIADVYATGAVLYFAITGVEPTEDPAELIPPSKIRSACSKALERVILRALQPAPEARFLSASEMLEDFASDAGAYTTLSTLDARLPPTSEEGPRAWEKRLRRAFGDDYELLAEIGAGGFGRVYRVRDLQLERMVALKVLHQTMIQDPESVERFRREAQLAARVTHPNIVSIYDIGGRSGVSWYTMELVEGSNLAQLVEKEGRLPLDRVTWMLREALGALAHAHSSGLVHRDIKPENILIPKTGGLKVTDFGLALALRGQGKFGGASSRSGTPQFASPEQLLGDRIDIRTDLYSLAAVAYFALLGYPPFAGSRPEVVLAKQTTNQLPDLMGERPEVGAEVAQVLRQALQADRNARYPTASEFLQALNRGARRDLRAKATPGWLKVIRRWLGPPRNPPPS
ncbi:MAG: serine/threonine protein kinase [Gemmatimonadetes bacterium]|nr:serine/threonine protein kinase [Gemmatimonadota bacterium]